MYLGSEVLIEVSEDHVMPRSTIFNSDLVLVDVFRLNLMSLRRTAYCTQGHPTRIYFKTT